MKAINRLQKLLTAPYEWFLIQEAKRGDREAFGKLYQHYLDRMYRFVFFRVGQKKEVAEDIVGDIFVKAWTKLDTFKKGNFQAWLYAIARNLVIDFYRAESKISIGVDEEVVDTKPTIEETVITSLACQEAMQAMSKLTEEQQEVLVLKFVEDMSNKEISRITGKKEDAIRALQHRGLTELRKILV